VSPGSIDLPRPAITGYEIGRLLARMGALYAQVEGKAFDFTVREAIATILNGAPTGTADDAATIEELELQAEADRELRW